MRTKQTTLAVVLFLFLLAISSPGHTGEIHWALSQPGEMVQITGDATIHEVPCGSYAVFYFSNEAFQVEEAPLHQGKTLFQSPLPVHAQPSRLETPPMFPVPDPLDAIGWDLQNEPWFTTQAPPSSPWVAVIDFDSGATADTLSHGRAVSWTIRLLSDESVNVKLYALDEENLSPPLDIPTASDVHFIIKLCDLMEDIDNSAIQLPVAVNMSFGRLANNDAGPCPVNQTTNLSCQIRQLLHRLATGLEIPLVAIAGNHGVNLFPATHEKVLSVGRLNLHQYNGGDAPQVWQNPPATGATFPGDGLSLSKAGTDPLLLPSGSSFAAASFTGVLSGALEQIPWTHADLFQGVWFPKETEPGLFALGKTETPDFPIHVSPQLSNLIERLTTSSPEICDESLDPQCLFQSQLIFDSGSLTGLESLPELQSNHVPGPDSKPCLPCFGDPGGPSAKVGTDSGLTRALIPDTLRIDLSQSEPLPAGWELLNVYLRVGDSDNYRLTDLDPQTLQDLQNGAVSNIELDLTDIPISNEDQVALVFKINYNPTGSSQCSSCHFWTSANVHISNQVLE